MTPILYSSDEIDFLNNGLGQLVDLYDVDIHEQRNGLLNLTAYYPVNGQHYADISEGNIILAKPSPLDDNHAFRIVSVALDITGYAVMIEADSITYDLTNNLSKTIHMLGDGQAAMTAIQNSTLHPHIFTFYSDITHTSESQLRYVNPMEAIAGTQGSFLQIWGGELKRENHRVAMFNRRGRDNVATFRLGKNIAGLKYTVDVSNLTTEIVPTVTVNSTDVSRTIEGATVQSSRMGNYPLVYSKMVDVSQDVKVDEGDTDDQIKAKINAFAADWFVKSANTGKDLPEVTVEVEVESLQDSSDYADKFAKLETIGLTDTVTVYVPEFGVNVTAIVNELHYDPVAERVTKLSIGTAKVSWADSNKNALNDLQDKVMEVKEQATEAVVSANGKNSTYSGRNEPAHPQEGDTWFWDDGADSGIKIFTNGDWVDSVDTKTLKRIDNAVDSAVSEATSHADSLNAAQTSMASSLAASTASALSAASDERNSLANMTNSMVADANAKSKSLADSAYAGAMAGVTSAGGLIAGVSSAVRAMGSAVSANSSAIAKAGNDLATGLSSAATYADSLTAKVGNSASAAVSSVSSDVNGIKAEFDSAKKTTHELSVATNSLSVGASGIAANLKEVTSTASGAMSAAASLAVDASGLHASYDKLSSQHAKDVETMNASYTAGISGIAASMATMQSTDRSLTSATNSLAITASGFTNSMAAVSSTASGAMSAAASLAANVSGVSASFNQLSNTVTRKVVSETVDLNTYVTTGKWFFSGRQTNAPQSGWAYVDVDAPSTNRLIQTWTYDQDASLQYSRYSIDNGKTWSSWVKAVQASDVTTAVNSASASYSAGINGLAADIKTVDTNAKGYATAAQNSAIATASQNATTITNTATTSLANGIAKTYATQTQLTQTASQFNETATKLQNKVNAMGQVNQLFNTEFSPDWQGWYDGASPTTTYQTGTAPGNKWGVAAAKYSGSTVILKDISSGANAIYSDLIPVGQNVPIVASIYTTSSNSNSSVTAAIYLRFYDSNKSYVGQAVVNSSSITSWQRIVNSTTTPTGTNYVSFVLMTNGNSGTNFYSEPMLVFANQVGDYVAGNYNNNARVSSLELDVDGITGVVNDPSKGLSATWNLANNGQTLAVQASNAAAQAITTANGIQTKVSAMGGVNQLSNTEWSPDLNGWYDSGSTEGTAAFTDGPDPSAGWALAGGKYGVSNVLRKQLSTGANSIHTGLVAVGPGVTVTASMFTYATSDSNSTVSGAIYLKFYDANKVYIGRVSKDSGKWTSWQRLVLTTTTPANTAYVSFNILTNGNSGVTYYAQPMLEFSATVHDYVAGNYNNNSYLETIRTQLAGQITDETINRTTGDNSVRQQMTDLINQQVTSVTTGYQSSLLETSNALVAQISSLNLVNNSGFEYVNDNQLQGWHKGSAWGATLTFNSGFYIHEQNPDGTISICHDYANDASWIYSDPIPATANANFAGSIEIAEGNGWNTSSQVPFAIDVKYYDANKNAINNLRINYAGTTIGGAWPRKSFTLTTPANTKYIAFGIGWNGGSIAFKRPALYAGSTDYGYIPGAKVGTQTALQLLKDNFQLGIKDNIGNIISGINGDTSGLMLTGKHIFLDGEVTAVGKSWLDGAVIKDATIGRAQIAELSVDSSKIINLDVNKLSGNVTNFIRSYWSNAYGSQVSINANLIKLTAGSGNATVLSDRLQFKNGSSDMSLALLPWTDIHGNLTNAIGSWLLTTGPANSFVSFDSPEGGSFMTFASSQMNYGANTNIVRGMLNIFSPVNISNGLYFYGHPGNTPSQISVDNGRRTMNFYTGNKSPSEPDGNYFWFNQNVYSSGVFASTSRLSKKNVKSAYEEDALSEIAKTQLVNFEYKNRIGQNHVSPIIDDVNDEKEYYIPETIVDQNGEYVDMYSMISMAWKAIQQLNEKIGEK
ncbi:phage tail spike protein [Weissella confusa]|uniref:phage tail spike protein n=1 Tax=Weissella confusa TaxID=1583 RepID=UPI00223A866B|nr:phage tail spike protein [Weissella confusa]